jgi:4-hydroxythreonine-4-phosphate dehydrogenase
MDIAVSMGDPCGIGPEVLAKALLKVRRIKDAAFFIFGDGRVLSRHGFRPSGNITLVDIKEGPIRSLRPGVPCAQAARASLAYLESAVAWLKQGKARALVTGPISKESVVEAGFSWPGHTEFLAHAFGSRHVEMVFVAESLKVVLLTRHVALKEAIASLKQDAIIACGRLSYELLKKDFKISHPRIAVCGLNPHASEAGLFGQEEKKIIAPACRRLNKILGKHFFGPLPADTVFTRASEGAFDLVMAMYHDQGLIPFKLLEFRAGVNLTAGLPIIRTSPVHGTAFDIAARRVAHSGSMVAALQLAYELTKNRCS